MIKDGDILKFKRPLLKTDRELLRKGGQYIAEQVQKFSLYQTDDGEWHLETLEEKEPLRVFLHCENICEDCGKLSQYKDFKVIGNIYEEAEKKNGKQTSGF